MSPENSAHPEQDEPLDAIVYDIHPALAPPAKQKEPEYPYGPVHSAAGFSGDNPFRSDDPSPNRSAARFAFPTAPTADYKVPQRFGMSAILGITTALAFLFGALRLLNAPPPVYLFFGGQGLAICIVQMFYGRTPRAASAIAGAIILPVFVMFLPFFIRGDEPTGAVVCAMAFSVPIGAFFGYLTGTCAAGIFLVMHALEPYLQGQRPASATASPLGPGGSS